MNEIKLKARMGFEPNRKDDGAMRYGVVARGDCYEFAVNITFEQYLALRKAPEVEITIAPIQTREERLREARVAGLKEFWRTTPMSGSYDEAKIIAVIERVDAEFAKENG